MFGMTTGVVLFADPSREPETILLGGGDADRVTEIQGYVGGHFDCVKRGCEDESGVHKPFVLVGYVHDEGRILNMPMNATASLLFEQHLFGDVVLVNGTNPETDEYDGETYGLPIAFAEYVIKGLYPQVTESILFSQMLATAVSFSRQEGAITEEQFQKVRSFMVERYNESGGSPAAQFGDLPEDIRDILKSCIEFCAKGDDQE